MSNNKTPLFTCNTNGRGLWGFPAHKGIAVTSLRFESLGHARNPGRSNRASRLYIWADVKVDARKTPGLIYTDPRFIRDFRRGFCRVMRWLVQIPGCAWHNLDYTEQGMQEHGCVSLEADLRGHINIDRLHSYFQKVNGATPDVRLSYTKTHTVEC